jgi:hypothetical protein
MTTRHETAGDFMARLVGDDDWTARPAVEAAIRDALEATEFDRIRLELLVRIFIDLIPTGEEDLDGQAVEKALAGADERISDLAERFTVLHERKARKVERV